MLIKVLEVFDATNGCQYVVVRGKAFWLTSRAFRDYSEGAYDPDHVGWGYIHEKDVQAVPFKSLPTHLDTHRSTLTVKYETDADMVTDIQLEKRVAMLIFNANPSKLNIGVITEM
ncbi:MAG: hypothetical protein ACK42D_04210 [Candidatus Paceibacteria bacterium]